MERFFESKPVIFLSKFVDLVVLNVLFVVCCIPVFTIGASWTALYYTCVKVIRMDCGTTVKDFFGSFRANFKTASVVWIFLAASFLLVSAGTYLLLANGTGIVGAMMTGLCMALLLFLIATILYTFPVLSRFTVRGGALIKNAMVMSAKHGGETIYMVVLTLAFATLVVIGWKFFPVILLIMPGLYTLLLSFFMEKILAVYTPQSAKEQGDISEDEMQYQEQDNRTPWYLEGGERNE
jgi:uncharacterized membrane protein YesL